MNQIERIQDMDNRMRRAQVSLEQFQKMKGSFAELVKDMEVLSSYYDSDSWMNDYTADEEHRIPNTIRRGVLSQDGLYDLLTEYDAFLEEICDLLEGKTQDSRKMDDEM